MRVRKTRLCYFVGQQGQEGHRRGEKGKDDGIHRLAHSFISLMRKKTTGIAAENYSRGQTVVTAAAALNYIARRS